MTGVSQTPAGPPLDRRGYELEIEDTFDAPELDQRLWIPHYLPQWSSRRQSAARYDVGGGRLALRIDHDQPPWSPEFDGWTRVSSLQTGVFAGALGSSVGQHRFRDGLVVREEQENERRYTPRYGLFEVVCRAIADPAMLVALWMIGYEDEPARSGEICIVEIFGRDVAADGARVGVGIHPFGDPALVDDFEAVSVPIDATEPHRYAAEWTPGGVRFFVDDRLVKSVDQSPDYPMQFMLNVYEFGAGPEPPSPPDAYPKTFVVEAFRGYRPVTGPAARPPAFPR